MTKDLSQRARLVLAAVISNYITTAEPVGSRTVSKLKQIDVSPATVRNVMSDLEEMGYLAQPHASAGRVPTAQGLRFYVDTILQVRELDAAAKAQIGRVLQALPQHSLREVMQATGQALSAVSQQVAVVTLPTGDQDVFRHVEFVLLRPGLILVVFVSQGGGVENRVIEAEADLTQDDMDKYGNYLNELLADLNLDQVRDRLAREMAREKVRFDRVLSRAVRLGQRVLQGTSAGQVLVEGQANLMGAPEFADVGRLRGIFRAFEEKSTLLRLVEKSLTAPGVRIFIGAESELAGLEGLTAVTATYGLEETPLGALGVIGPNRMDYSQVIPMVEYTARLVSRIVGLRDKS